MGRYKVVEFVHGLSDGGAETLVKEYIVEADSADEAEESVLDGFAILSDEVLDYTDGLEITEIEPFVEKL